MFRAFVCAVFAAMSLITVSPCMAQWPANITNSPSSKTNAWTFRDGNRAIAFYIEETNGILFGKLCMYKFDTARNYYKRVAIKIDTENFDTIDISLTDSGKGFEIRTNTSSLPSNTVIGWISAGPGNKSSIIRWNDKIRFEGTPIKQPCEAPPADDVGEEEEITSQSPMSKSPGAYMDKDPVKRPTPGTTTSTPTP